MNLPYVYKLVHKETGQFYIGYREANKLPAIEDLPIYKTSSVKVKMIGFQNFDWEIVAEFDNPDRIQAGIEAYDFEQQLIHESLDDPLILNQHCQVDGKDRFKTTGPLDEEVKAKMRKPKGKRNKPTAPMSEEHKAKIAEAHIGVKQSEESIAKMLETRKKNGTNAGRKAGTKMSEETKEKMRQSKIGKKRGPYKKKAE